MSEPLRCNRDLDDGKCRGEVGFWTRPSDWTAWPYCSKHAAEAQTEFERIDRLYGVTSDVPPAGFDPTACGEEW